MSEITLPQRPDRHFLPADFTVTSWEALKPFFDDLANRSVASQEELERWFKDRSELEALVSEDLGWRYIKMTCDTANEEVKGRYEEFVTQIQPNIAPLNDQLNRKALASEYLGGVSRPGYSILVRSMKKEAELFREENIPLQTKLAQEAQKFGAINGAMTVEHEGEELTMQQAGVFLQKTDRALREAIYHKIQARRQQDRDALDALFDELVKLRHQVATNAGFENYRDYMFQAMGRFDYTPEDCFTMHKSVAKSVVPITTQFAQERKQAMGLDTLRPWDGAVDPHGREPLKPFENGEELLEKTVEVFNRLDPFLGNCLKIMRQMGHLDLVSRKGKAPGGYNYPLSEIGVPFIFMNATSTVRDMVTLLHEGGHAVHSLVTRELELVDFKHTPSEVAELASMSMELISMGHWNVYFDDAEELKRAKKDHLEGVIGTLTWVATIDKFQHWVYENHGHSREERTKAWNEIYGEFSTHMTDWAGFEAHRDAMWQKQLHLFEVPFYYIEYGMAQLGAIAVWKNYMENAQQGLQGYLNALKLGYTQTIPEIYAAAGVKFDFSQGYIKELMQFVQDQMAKL